MRRVANGRQAGLYPISVDENSWSYFTLQTDTSASEQLTLTSRDPVSPFSFVTTAKPTIVPGDVNNDGLSEQPRHHPLHRSSNRSHRNRRTRTEFARLPRTGLDDGAKAQAHLKSNR